MTPLPTSARVVIIESGVSGCSVAYHLAKLGWHDIVLLKRKQLTCSTTWHAAGLVGQLRGGQNMTWLAKYSADLYAELEAATGLATGFRQTGSITGTLTAHRKKELLHSAGLARVYGVAVDVLAPAEMKNRYQHLNTQGMTAGVWLSKDGQADPSNVALALARGARDQGVRIFEAVKVTAVTKAKGRVIGVCWQQRTEHDHITTDLVVNCAGMWARDLAYSSKVSIPLHACEHFYIVTEAIPGLGAGLALAYWMNYGEAPFDLWKVDIHRSQPFQRNRLCLRERFSKTLGLLYADHNPNHQPVRAHCVRRSPLHEHLKTEGGGIACNLTVTRPTDSAFLMVVSGATLQRDLAWLRRHLADAFAVITDVTTGEAVLTLMGSQAREIEIGMELACAHRATYVGELGWQIHVSTYLAAHVFESLVEAGEDHGLKFCWLHAINSCRLEKEFHHFGHDIADEDHVLKAGLGFAAKADKGNVLGCDGVLEKRITGLSRRLIQFRLADPDAFLFHNEPLPRDRQFVGDLTSRSYGHALGGAVGLGYVRCAHPGETDAKLLASDYAEEVAGCLVAAGASLKPMYDPGSQRVRG